VVGTYIDIEIRLLYPKPPNVVCNHVIRPWPWAPRDPNEDATSVQNLMREPGDGRSSAPRDPNEDATRERVQSLMREPGDGRSPAQAKIFT